jgi:hypothetical protein
MEPLFFRYRLQLKRIKLAPHNAGATSGTLVPVIYRHPAIFSFFPGMRKKPAPPDELPAVGAFFVILDSAVFRSLDRLRQGGQSFGIRDRAAATAAVTAADELRLLRSHGESIEPLDNRVCPGIEVI